MIRVIKDLRDLKYSIRNNVMGKEAYETFVKTNPRSKINLNDLDSKHEDSEITNHAK